MNLHSRSRTTRNFQYRSSDFTLCIFEEDFIHIGKLVSKIPYAETGGNLFGLWTNNGNAVVLVATGPGKNCKRSSVSFYQDIPYMKRVGDLLTVKYPLCHIGEWHSHHQMQLYHPSFGDCNTVQRNYPTGSQGFVLMIANILQDGKVKLSPYKFTGERSPYIELGDIEIMAEENPFMKVEEITSAIGNGKEKMPQQQLSRTAKERNCQGARDSYSFKLKNNDLEKRANMGSSSRQRSRSRSRSPIKKCDSSPEEEDIDFRKNRPTRRAPATSEKAASNHRSYDYNYETQQSPAARSIPTLSSGEGKFSRRNLTTQWYDTELDILKTTLNFVNSLTDDPRTVKMKRDEGTLNLTTHFKHHDYEWSITYPCDFPRGSVELKKKSGLERAISLSVKWLGDIQSFKNTLQTTLQDQCTKCKRMVSYNDVLGLQERHDSEGHQRSRGETLTAQWHEIQPTTLERTLDFVTSLDDGKRTPKISRDQSTKTIAMEFTHHNQDWEVEFPPNFPTGKVKLNTKVKGSAEDYTRSFAYPGSYSYRNSFPLPHILYAHGDLKRFKDKLKSVLYNNCKNCKKIEWSNNARNM